MPVNRRRRLCLFAILLLLLMRLAGAAAQQTQETGIPIQEITKYGNVELAISGSEFLSQGYEFGDIVSVSIGDQSYDMPVGSSYSDVNDGEMICRVEIGDEEDRLVLAINMGDFASSVGIAVKEEIDEEPGYCWNLSELNPPVFFFSVKERGGYANEYSLRQLVRTNERTDYPHLTDAEFANFREMTTSGMGNGVFYRSSSPIDPQLGRNAFADAALKEAGIRTVINLADTMEGAQAYPGYSESAYSACNVIALNLGMDVHSEAFASGLSQGLRFMMEHGAPYLVHCTEGKDRGGFVSAILACLMGASWQEVMEDYMTTYENYYGTQPDSESYRIIAESNMKKTLEAAFDVEDIAAPGVRLADEAQAYMTEHLGLTDGETERLRDCLSGM